MAAKAPVKKDRREYNEAQELENLQRVFHRLDKKGDNKVRAGWQLRSITRGSSSQTTMPWRRLIATSSSTI